MILLSPSPDSSCRGAKQPSDLPHVYEEIGCELGLRTHHETIILLIMRVTLEDSEKSTVRLELEQAHSSLHHTVLIVLKLRLVG